MNKESDNNINSKDIKKGPSKIVPMEILGEIIKEQLNNGGSVRFTPKGVSMLPMLRDNLDAVLLEKNTGKLKKYDLPLYQRKNEKYILHRVIGFTKEGEYIMCGDNQVIPEYGITDSQIIGVVTEFERKGKSYTINNKQYRIYCRMLVALLPVRRVYRKGKNFLKMVYRKVRRKLGNIKRLIMK